MFRKEKKWLMDVDGFKCEHRFILKLRGNQMIAYDLGEKTKSISIMQV